MTYLERLKQKKSLYDELPKLPKVLKMENKPTQHTAKTSLSTLDSKGSTLDRCFSENQKGNCESCCASGYWDYADYAGKLLCFEYAVFRGKSGKPKPCNEMRHSCPLKKIQ